MDDIYFGGYKLGPTEEVPLPRVTLTKQQLRENAKARAKHDKQVSDLQKLAEKAEKLGGWFEELGFPEFEPPHDPDAYDFSRFGTKEQAYYEYLEKGDKASLIKLKSFGMKFKYYPGMLMSVGAWPPPGPPELPDWAK